MDSNHVVTFHIQTCREAAGMVPGTGNRGNNASGTMLQIKFLEAPL